MTRFIAHLRETARGGGALPAWASKGERGAIARHFAGHARAVPAEFIEAEIDREDACSQFAAPNARGPPSPSGRGRGTATP